MDWMHYHAFEGAKPHAACGVVPFMGWRDLGPNKEPDMYWLHCRKCAGVIGKRGKTSAEALANWNAGRMWTENTEEW